MTGYTLDYLRGERDRLQGRMDEEQQNLALAKVREANALQQIEVIEAAHVDVSEAINKLEEG